MKLVADSFAWPFRGEWRSRWFAGVLAVLFLPLLFVPLLGYAIDATRAAERDSTTGPPPWRLSARLLADGAWTALMLLVIALPFALVYGPLTGFFVDTRVWSSSDAGLASLHARVLAAIVLALPFGLALLLLMPHATAAFAASGRPADLFDVSAAVRRVGADFTTWNVAAAAIVTAWAIGAACSGLLCVGVLPGVFYAILVSAHASAALHDKGPAQPAR